MASARTAVTAGWETLLAVDGRTFRFRHALIRDAVLASAPPADVSLIAERVLVSTPELLGRPTRRRVENGPFEPGDVEMVVVCTTLAGPRTPNVSGPSR